MRKTHLAGLAATVLVVVGGIAALAAHRVARMQAPAPVVVESASPQPQPDARPTPPPPVDEPEEPVLTDAQWRARYERSRRAVAERTAREAREQRAREAAWERQQRELVMRASPLPTPARPTTVAPPVEAAPAPVKPKPKPKPLQVMYVFTTWCPHCDRMLPAVQELARRPNVTVTGICADSAEAYDQWRRDHGNAGFRVRQMSRDDARREIERFGGSYAGPVPFVAAKSGSTLVYDRSGAPNPASLLLDRLADHM